MLLYFLGHNSFMRRQTPYLLLALMLGALVSGCAGSTPVTEDDVKSREELRREGTAKIFGDDAFTLGSTSKNEAGGVGITVNSFLWRASLDTISFMPLSSADPFGGVIITDWYTTPDSTRDRLKVQVYILDRQLRSDGLRVSVFRQTLDDAGAWIHSTVSGQTIIDLENAILTRARQLRISSNDAQ
jgi:hypothetical protein